MSQEILYLNTDLELKSAENLTPLSEAFDKLGLCPLHVGPGNDGCWIARFEMAKQFENPDENIKAMLAAINVLDETCNQLWSSCTVRDFDIGYECGNEPWGYHQDISPQTIAGIAAVGAGLVIHIYTIDPHRLAGENFKNFSNTRKID